MNVLTLLAHQKMKKDFSILFLLFFINVYSQSGYVQYSIHNVKMEKIDKEFKKVRNKKAIEFIKNTKDVIGNLYFKKNESLYSLENPMKSEANKGINLTRFFAGKKEVTRYNTKDTLNLVQKHIGGNIFLISKPLFHWKITRQTKKIGKYICYKAVVKDTRGKKKEISVWFTPQIPVQFGPRQFNGLPGLVLEVNHSILQYKATKIELNSKKEIKIQVPKKGKRMTEKEYNSQLKEQFPAFFRKNK